MNTATATMMDFSAIIQNRNRFELDLSHCTLVEALQEYQNYKRKVNPKFSLNSVISNIQIMEVSCGSKLIPRDVTDIFYGLFITLLTRKDLGLGTQKLYCTQIRTALKWASKHNCPTSSTYDTFNIAEYEPATIALSVFEVSHIANFDIDALEIRPQHKRTLKRVRDHFCLSCNLGQRYSDMIRITPENFNNGIFTCTQQKTGNKCRVDMKRYNLDYKYTQAILKKYGYKAPYTGNINNYNKYLHELVEIIGKEFGDMVKIERKINGQIETLLRERFKMISSHCARRTFATYNRMVREYDHLDIMKATGHKSIECFKRYVREED